MTEPGADVGKHTAGTARVDTAAWERRRERLSVILSAMADHAMVQATFRCPYKNRHDECTAKFGCRNQRPPRPDRNLLTCGGDDKLDYRSAWDSAEAEAPVDTA